MGCLEFRGVLDCGQLQYCRLWLFVTYNDILMVSRTHGWYRLRWLSADCHGGSHGFVSGLATSSPAHSSAWQVVLALPTILAFPLSVEHLLVSGARYGLCSIGQLWLVSGMVCNHGLEVNVWGPPGLTLGVWQCCRRMCNAHDPCNLDKVYRPSQQHACELWYQHEGLP